MITIYKDSGRQIIVVMKDNVALFTITVGEWSKLIANPIALNEF